MPSAQQYDAEGEANPGKPLDFGYVDNFARGKIVGSEDFFQQIGGRAKSLAHQNLSLRPHMEWSALLPQNRPALKLC
jgi:hypothetical protein